MSDATLTRYGAGAVAGGIGQRGTTTAQQIPALVRQVLEIHAQHDRAFKVLSRLSALADRMGAPAPGAAEAPTGRPPSPDNLGGHLNDAVHTAGTLAYQLEQVLERLDERA